jgi:hypothetical protein
VEFITASTFYFIMNYFIGAFVFSVFLWDFYIDGIRFFDFVSIGLIFTYFLISNLGYFYIRKFPPWHILFFVIIFLSVVHSFFYQDNHDFTSLLGIFAFSVVYLFLVFFVRLPAPKYMVNIIDGIIALLLLLFYIQFVLYYSIGVEVDYLGYLIERNARVFNSNIGTFRPAGIFMEANAHSLSMLYLIAMRYKFDHSFSTLPLLSILSMILSTSLWGIVSSILLVFLYKLSSGTECHRKSRNSISIYLIIAIILVLFIAYYDQITSSIMYNLVLDRVNNIESNQSAIDRYSGLFNMKNFDYYNLIFGGDIGTTTFQSRYGANGLSFMLSSFGLLGMVSIFFCLFLLIEKKDRFFIFPLIVIINTTHPSWYYMVWWLFLFIITYRYRYEVTIQDSAP